MTVEKQTLKHGKEKVGKCKAQPLGLTSESAFREERELFKYGIATEVILVRL